MNIWDQVDDKLKITDPVCSCGYKGRLFEDKFKSSLHIQGINNGAYLTVHVVFCPSCMKVHDSEVE